MKPVENISIGGYVFFFEEDACEKLTAYIDELNSFYRKRESGFEVMEGIEERMAELFLEKCGRGGVVTISMVDSVTSTLGRPEAIEEESSFGEDSYHSGDCADSSSASDDKESASSSWQQSKDSQSAADPAKKGEAVRKKLYRNPSEGKIAGVCSGLSVFFNIDVAVIRTIFAVLAVVGLIFTKRNIEPIAIPLLYIILWICMPAAKTVQQKDEMRGMKGTVDAISKRVESGAREVADTAAEFGKSQTGQNLMKFFGIIIGLIFLIVGLSGSAASGTLMLGGNFLGKHSFLFNKLMENVDFDPMAMYFLSDLYVMIPLLLVICIPFIGLAYKGIRMIFGLKSPSWSPGLCLFVLWIVAFITFIVMTAIRYPDAIANLGF